MVGWTTRPVGTVIRGLLLLLAGLPLPALGAGLPTATPESVGLSSQRLQRLGDALKQHLAKQELAGAVVLVARRGHTVYHHAMGARDIEAGLPMETDAIFRIASMTKLVTSVGAMTLYEEGRFRLDEPVSGYIPEVQRFKVAVPGEDDGLDLVEPAREITIRDLLRHTSGVSYGGGFNHVDDLYQEADARLREGDNQHLVDELTQLPLAWHPGARWEYSYSTDILALLIEKLSGERLDRFLATRILKPLGMGDSGFFVPPEKRHRLPSLYRLSEGRLVVEERAGESTVLHQPERCSGGGGMVSTASDYARFLQMLLNGGELEGRRILGRRTVELMLTDHLQGIDPNWLAPGAGFGLGPAVVTDEARFGQLVSAGTFFWAGSYNTFFFADPEEEVIGILMTQTSPFPLHDLATRLRVLTMQAIED